MSKLKERRTNKGYSQSQLAKLSGVGLRMIQQCEQGHKDINNAKAISLYAISKVLDCTIEDLLETT